MKSKINLIFFAFVCACPLYAQQTLSFPDALLIMQQNSHVLKQSGLQEVEKANERKASKGLYMPNVSLNASYVNMSNDLQLDLTPVKDAITPLYSALSNYGVFSGVPNPDPATNGAMPVLPDNISTAAVRDKMAQGLEKVNNGEWVKTIQENEFASVNAGFVWPLYTGGKINVANKVSGLKCAEAKELTRQKSGEVINELVERYFGLKLAQSVVEVRRVVYTGLQQHYSDAQKLRQNGMIADAELLHAKMFFYEAGRELKKSVRDAAIVAQGLQSTLAGGATDSIVPTDHLFVVADIETLDWFRTTALANNPLLAQVDIKKSMAEQGVKANRADLLPTLAAMGKYDIAKYQLSEYSPEWMVGVGLKWTLFDGASGHRKLKASKLVLEQVQEADLKANSDVEAGVTKYYQELMSAREQVEQLQMSLDFAAEYLRIREKAFKEGMATSTEVVDAQLNLAKVRTERLSAVYKFDVALIKLLQTCGIPEQFELLRQTGIVIN